MIWGMIGNLSFSLYSSQEWTGVQPFDFTTLYPASANALAGGGAVYGVGSIGVALQNAEKNEAKQLEQVAKSPEVVRDLAHYEKVVSRAKSFSEVLDDPIARKVLMKAHGLGDQVDYVGLARKAMMSDPNDPKSLANQLAKVNGAWLEFAQSYNIAKNGLEALYPQQDGFAAKWRVTVEREGKPHEVVLEIEKVRGGWQGKADGKPMPVEVNNGLLKVSYIWNDSEDQLRLTRLEGRLGRDGVSLSGVQFDDSVEASVPWRAALYGAGAVSKVRENYIAEMRLDMLDQQLPGLGSAVLFKKMAATLDTPVKILASALGREVITTAFGIPKEIALQSMVAQEKAISQRMDPKKLAGPQFVERLVQRYLIQLNGGVGGVLA